MGSVASSFNLHLTVQAVAMLHIIGEPIGTTKAVHTGPNTNRYLQKMLQGTLHDRSGPIVLYFHNYGLVLLFHTRKGSGCD